MSSTLDRPRDSKVALIRGVVVRFAGDSGDGMQVTGDRFTTGSALFGNDLATLPSFPAEIRAPAGTLAGVSAFQVHIADHDILTPGDAPSVLVAMNPAALRANVGDLATGGTVILNADAFDERALEKAGYTTDPRSDGSLASFLVYEVPMTSLTLEACKPTGAKPREAERSKNFLALGLVSWLYHRPVDVTLDWIAERYAKNPTVVAANSLAFRAGYNFGETAELFESSYEIPASHLEPGTYTNVTGNTALAWGLVAASQRSGLPLFLGSYPITPASDLLHELAKQKHFGVRTFQAEDEIAGVGAALGAAFGGSLGVTTTSGPGLDLKSETIGLAVSLELPLLVIDVQRGGPSTGLPTKTEQSDLLHAMFGRHGEAPVPIVAARTPSHCFEAAMEAVRIAVRYRTPVILLSDGYLANGSEPWRLPDVDTLPTIDPGFAVETNYTDAEGNPLFWPYLRDAETLARPWAVPGTPGLEHRVGGLEKADGTGNVSYDPANHEQMVRLRAAKIAGIAKDIPPVEVDDPDGARVLVLGWGSTYGAITAAVRRVRAAGLRVA
jgi:2-oxoglutarate ferredoxin oxidoreductase subunit alpha